MRISRATAAEFMGTFWLVFGGCGAAVLAATFPVLGIGFLGIALAFGLSLMTMVYVIGKISGCHVNPAVSVGLTVAGRFPRKDLAAYVGAQLLGAIAAAALLYMIATGRPAFDLGGFAANGYGDYSPGLFSMGAVFAAELVLTFMFLMIILGSTDARAPASAAPIAIGLGLTLIHLISLPIDNTSVNPARSTGPALVAGPWAIRQLWLFWVAPILGAAAAGYVYPRVFGVAEKPLGRAEPGRAVAKPVAVEVGQEPAPEIGEALAREASVREEAPVREVEAAPVREVEEAPVREIVPSAEGATEESERVEPPHEKPRKVA